MLVVDNKRNRCILPKLDTWNDEIRAAVDPKDNPFLSCTPVAQRSFVHNGRITVDAELSDYNCQFR